MLLTAQHISANLENKKAESFEKQRPCKEKLKWPISNIVLVPCDPEGSKRLSPEPEENPPTGLHITSIVLDIDHHLLNLKKKKKNQNYPLRIKIKAAKIQPLS